MRKRFAARAGGLALAAAVLASGGGCVAVDVGRPLAETVTAGERVVRGEMVRCEVLSVEPRCKALPGEGRLRAWLEADVRRTYEQWNVRQDVTHETQRRLAIGVFPGAARAFSSLDKTGGTRLSDVGTRSRGETIFLYVYGFPLWLPGALDTLLVEPFSGVGWSAHPEGVLHGLGTFGLAGIYKFAEKGNYTVVPVRERLESVETERKTFPVAGTHGPYEVELQIGGAGYGRTQRVEGRNDAAVFELPRTERGGDCEAVLTFRALPAGGGTNREERAVAGAWDVRVLRTTVFLKAQEPPELPVAVAAAVPAPRIVERVVEKHIYHDAPAEKVPEGAPYNVERTAGGGWRVTILREGLTAFQVDPEVKPHILEELRSDFLGRHPGVPPEEIKAFASYTTENGGRTLLYAGGVSALVPSLESLVYDPETRRGTVTMRLAGGADDLRRAKEFVRDHISAIVCDQNVVLVAGERPPDGARYRTGGEQYADGVLTVEFEAVE